MGGFSESNSLTLTIWYKHHLEIILQAFRKEMIRPLAMEFSPFHSKTGLLAKLSLTILFLQPMEAKQACN